MDPTESRDLHSQSDRWKSEEGTASVNPLKRQELSCFSSGETKNTEGERIRRENELRGHLWTTPRNGSRNFGRRGWACY